MAATLAAATAAGLAAVAPSPLRSLDRLAHDTYVRQTAPPAASSRIAIVAVDEASLAALGQWPWPRDVLARLVTRLREAGAAAIAFDILFPEPDRLAPPGAAGAGSTTTDDAFVAAVRAAPVVMGAGLTFEPPLAGARASCHLAPSSPITRHLGDDDPFAQLFAATGAVCSLPALNDAARAVGTINASPDDDGVLRRLPVLTRHAGQVQRALALAAVQVATPRQPLFVDAPPGGGLAVAPGLARVDLDAQGHVLLRPRGPGHTYPYLSAAAVIAGQVPPSAVSGRIVFVGATALGVRDAVTTPLDSRFPGVELHATLADTLLGGAGAARPVTARAIEVLGAGLAGLLAALLVTTLGPVTGTALVAAVGAGTWFAFRSWFAATGAVVSPAGPIVGLALGTAAGLVSELVFERRRANAETERREQAQRLIVQSLTSLTETRDVETGRHARRTQESTRLLASTLAGRGHHRRFLTPHRIDLIATLAPLHDIGKVGISDAVLHKPGQLTPSEYDEMKQHATLGHETLRKAERLAGVHDNEVLALAKDIVFTHHERWDGTGYPRGLTGTAIPLPGRLVAVVDTYDALVAERPYKAALPHDEALAIIQRGRGTHFDPDIVDAFVACAERLRDAGRGHDDATALVADGRA